MAGPDCVETILALLRKVLSTFPDMGNVSLSKRSIPIRRKLRDLSCGDIVLPKFIKLDSCQNDELLQFIQEAVIQRDIPVTRVVRDGHNLLTFFLKRHRIIKEIVTEVHTKTSKYGMSEFGEGQTVCLNPVSSPHKNCPTEYRRSIVMSHAANLLRANGFDVHVIDEMSSDEGQKDTPQSVEETTHHTHNPSGVHESTSVHHCHFVSKVKKLLDGEDTQKAQFIGMERIIAEHKLIVGKDGVDKNLHQLEVFNAEGEVSDILKEAAVLENKLDFIMKREDTVYTCMHVVPQKRAYRQQQVLLLNLALSDKNYLQSQLIVGPVMCRKENSMDDIYRMRYDQMKQASELRYGHICEGAKWETQFNLLTQAGLTFDLLGTAPHSPLHLDLEASSPSDSRLGSFVLYNTARLATLLQHFSQEVEKGTYPPLPAIETVDFSLLREEEDWELVFLYISSFPGLVRDSVEMVSSQQGHILAKIHTHKVVNFLTTFSKSLSSYYSRYHILGGGEPHLLPLMYARLYLMQAAHQVLVSALQLLDIPALDQL